MNRALSVIVAGFIIFTLVACLNKEGKASHPLMRRMGMVTAREAYHDGKKGELSYYEPWGDALMLYKDFHAGDEMHRLNINLTGIKEIAKMSAFPRCPFGQELTKRRVIHVFTINTHLCISAINTTKFW